MRVLLLSNNWEVVRPVKEYLEEREILTCFGQDINGLKVSADCVVSYCYRYILSRETIDRYGGRVVNLHNSYLPWGRGAQPLFWAMIDDEPVGVSIHWMDAGLDTGKVIAREPVQFDYGMTFRELYDKQHAQLAKLFIRNWEYIRGMCGSYHTTADFDKVKSVLGPEGWDCKIGDAIRRWRA